MEVKIATMEVTTFMLILSSTAIHVLKESYLVNLTLSLELSNKYHHMVVWVSSLGCDNFMGVVTGEALPNSQFFTDSLAYLTKFCIKNNNNVLIGYLISIQKLGT